MDAETVGGGTGLVIVTAAITRWLSTRSVERQSALAQMQDALDAQLQRVAKLEGRLDELSSRLAQEQAARTAAEAKLVQVTIELEQLRGRIATLETEREQLRARIATLEAERDALAAKVAGRRTITPQPFEAQTTPVHPADGKES